MKLGDEQAFPGIVKRETEHFGVQEYSVEGMTLRQYYAGLAMQGLLASMSKEVAKEFVAADTTVIKVAVKAADDLLAELEK